MRVLIFGLGTLGGGFSSASYFLDHNHQVRVTDLRSEESLGGPLEILKNRGASVRCQEHKVEDFEWADLVIKNPAIPPDSPYLKHAKRIETDISYLLRSPLAKNLQLIVVTGTKGKTYTVAAVAHILNSHNKETLQFGNMGISGFSILSKLEQREKEGISFPSFLACELSSWQIRDLYSSLENKIPKFALIALTSLFPDHLNWYNDFQSYKEDKFLLFGSAASRMVIPEEVIEEFSDSSGRVPKGIKSVESYKGVTSLEIRVQTAAAICRSIGLGMKQIESALRSFRGVPHRQEQLGLFENVLFINDSAATIPESVTFSTLSLSLPYHLICGGTDKNLKADGMLHALQRASSIHLLEGSFTTEKLIPLLKREKLSYSGPFSSMKEVFESAFKLAHSERRTVALILSPGAASFGLFLHEFDRGDQFRTLVKSLSL